MVGGSEGIGLAVARELVASGAEVEIAGRSADKLDAAAELLGESVATWTVDVTDEREVHDVVDALVADVGVPDLVVVTAGFARASWFEEADSATERALMETNYFGTVNVCRAVVPHLVAAGRGTVVTTSSMAGFTGVPGYTGYSASKFAVLGFSEALRRELDPTGVRVVTLCPPNTRTPGFDEENLTKPAEVLAAEEQVATLSPDQVARALLRALRRRRPRVVVPGRDGRLAHLGVRLLPGLTERMLRRR